MTLRGTNPPTPPSRSTVELTDVEAAYGSLPVLKNTTVRLDQGITLLAATNGSGKTMLLRLCAGILRPRTGLVRVLDGDPYQDAVRQHIGYLSHQTGLDPGLTVTQNLLFWAGIHGDGPRMRRQHVAEVVEELDLRSLASTTASQL